jgi:hypothetical protein
LNICYRKGAATALPLRVCGATLLVALQTVNRPALRQLEGHGGFLAALGTNRGCDGPRAASSTRKVRARLNPLALATLATLGFVLKTLLGVEELIAGRENKLPAALDTL